MSARPREPRLPTRRTATTPASNFSDDSLDGPSISYDVTSAFRYDVSSAANSYEGTSDERGRAYLELSEGTPAEAKRGLDLLRKVLGG